MKLTILYRGPLSSCNYDCSYCPFAKRHETTSELDADRRGLARFVAWVASRRDHQFSILFTPWGEALVRDWYREALVELTRLDHVVKAAIQTNLSCPMGWIADARLDRLAVWATYHPSQVDRRRFLSQCQKLDALGVRYSVGMVGMRDHQGEIAAMRRELPPHIYMWINAYKDAPNYYLTDEVRFLEAIDPQFPVNNTRHASLGEACRTGESVISVDGDGTVRRCHFIAEPIGNLYEPNFERALRPRLCTNATCGCHIGYVHLERLHLDEVFGDGILERVPCIGYHSADSRRSGFLT
jgi:MoaA/NifB/PqqE/SkfB family radical SAM enzyme